MSFIKVILLAIGLVMPLAAQPHGNAAQVAAELSRGISSSHSRAGQPIAVTITEAATLTDGSTLPVGSRLTGRLTQVHPLHAGTSSLKLLFTQTGTPDGHRHRITGTVQSVGGRIAPNPGRAGASTARSGGTILNPGMIAEPGITTAGGLAGTVTRLSGVSLRADGILFAHGKEVEIPAGTPLTLSVSPR